ncbi:MAG: non-canonical purine NTP pyrophosphatase [bacterium]|nr:non-canonical purine NTP pyrophosphatase [bacterium]
MLTFVTGNKNKLAEVQAILGDVQQLDVEVHEIQELDPHAIIKHKLDEARHHSKAELIVEDTSLYCDGLKGLPGPFIKWFLKLLGPAGLAKLVIGTGNTRATAKSIVGYSSPSGEIEFFEGRITGTIVEPRGPDKFGWDPIFMPEGFCQTFAEMPQDQKNKISMRRQALDKLKTHLRSR